MKEVVGFLYGRRSFFSPPKTISSSCMSVEKQYVMKFSSGRAGRSRLVAAREPGVEAAADGPVGDVEYVARGPQHHALAAGVRAAALGNDAREVRTLAWICRHRAGRAGAR